MDFFTPTPIEYGASTADLSQTAAYAVWRLALGSTDWPGSPLGAEVFTARVYPHLGDGGELQQGFLDLAQGQFPELGRKSI